MGTSTTVDAAPIDMIGSPEEVIITMARAKAGSQEKKVKARVARKRLAKKKRAFAPKVPAEAAMPPGALVKLRKLLRMTQQDLADRLGVKVLTIHLWEKGTTPISKSRALALQMIATRESQT